MDGMDSLDVNGSEKIIKWIHSEWDGFTWWFLRRSIVRRLMPRRTKDKLNIFSKMIGFGLDDYQFW